MDKVLERFEELDVPVFTATNSVVDRAIEKKIGLPNDRYLYAAQYGLKGKHGFVNHVCNTVQCGRNEIVYLGDGDNDMYEAAGSKVALFNADWSQKNRYGFTISSPQEFQETIEGYFLKEHLWYYSVDENDALNRPVKFRALLNPEKCKNTGYTQILKERASIEDQNSPLYQKAEHLIMHLIASFYLDGLHLIRELNAQGGNKKPQFCIYPGSQGDKSPILELFESFTSTLLSMEYKADLLRRHATAKSSKSIRMSGGHPAIEDQFATVEVNPAYVKRVKGNVVFVLDDFSTGSNAMETSRNLLMACGAKQVIGLTVGKYGLTPSYAAYTPQLASMPAKGGPVPNAACISFPYETFAGNMNLKALEEF